MIYLQRKITMRLKSISMAIAFATFSSSFISSSHASDISGTHVPDEIVFQIFSYLKPHKAGSIASVSQQFNKVACSPESPIGKVNETQASQDLYKFCRAQKFEEGQVLALARHISTMTTNPLPTIISTQEFNDAKEYAKDVLSHDK